MKRLIEWLWERYVASDDDKHDLLEARFNRLNEKNFPSPNYLKNPKATTAIEEV